VWFTNNNGVNPFLGVPIAAVVCAVLALPTSYLVFRLAGGYFAIGTWVVAEVAKLFTTQIGSLGRAPASHCRRCRTSIRRCATGWCIGRLSAS
jgi:ABC-type branched-subunit amino acid transport system permease subunit